MTADIMKLRAILNTIAQIITTEATIKTEIIAEKFMITVEKLTTKMQAQKIIKVKVKKAVKINISLKAS